MAHLAPVGGDHVGGGGQAGGAAELGHHLAAGVAVLGAAGVLGIGQHAVQVAAQGDGLVQRPAAVGIEGDARLGEALGQGADRLHLGLAAQHAALELEVLEAVAGVGRLGLADDGLGSQRLLVAHAEPGVVGVGLVAVAEVGLAAVADEEQVAEHLHLVALLAFAEQGGDRHAEVLAEQVEQRRLQCGDRMDGDA
ncbi:hypothetical protein D3C78_1253560 [compost metagenome]